MTDDDAKLVKISDIGEKRLISEFIRPLFNNDNITGGVGDDCAMIDDGNGVLWLFSTDRVPADLRAFVLGIIDHYGLGKYLAALNISDIAACGGTPIALLLNLGLPNDLLYQEFKAICEGFKYIADKYNVSVLGGDISASAEISISATSIGKVRKDFVLTRRNSNLDDTIFISKPLGLTPAAFGYHLRLNKELYGLDREDIELLNRQFTDVEPLVQLSQKLSESGECTSCTDNTDGVGQSLSELALESQKAFVVVKEQLQIPTVVYKVASQLAEDAHNMALSSGADFSLVGTLKGQWTQEKAQSEFGSAIQVIGYVSDGAGVYLESNNKREVLRFSGWNYFSTTT